MEINTKSRSYRKDLDTQKMIDLFKQGIGVTEIGELLQCTNSLVGWRLRRLGMKRTKSESLKIAWVRRRRKLIDNMANPNWQGGGRYQDTKGYIRVYSPGHHRRWGKQNYTFEHIIVWEKANNEEVPKGYCIHHLNGIKNDNRPENLVKMKNGEHTNQTIPYRNRIKELEQLLISSI